MKIALDYDRTFTLDPLFWEQVVTLGRARGHEFVCVTGRHTPPGSHERYIPMPVVCAGSAWKRDAAARAGHQVDVWIDDMPEMIAPTRILDFGVPASGLPIPSTLPPGPLLPGMQPRNFIGGAGMRQVDLNPGPKLDWGDGNGEDGA